MRTSPYVSTPLKVAVLDGERAVATLSSHEERDLARVVRVIEVHDELVSTLRGFLELPIMAVLPYMRDRIEAVLRSVEADHD